MEVHTLKDLEKALRKLGISPRTHYVILDYSKMYLVSISDKDERTIIIEPKNKHEKIVIPNVLLKKGFRIILDVYPK